MSPFRQEIREFIRASERILSLESFDTPLTEEERGAVLLLIEYLTKNLPRPSVIKTDGNDQDHRHDGATLADLGSTRV